VTSYTAVPQPSLHSFPTRRSSDLIRNSSGPSTELGDDTRERPTPLEGCHLTCQMQSDAARHQPARFDPVGGKGGATRFLASSQGQPAVHHAFDFRSTMRTSRCPPSARATFSRKSSFGTTLPLSSRAM